MLSLQLEIIWVRWAQRVTCQRVDRLTWHNGVLAHHVGDHVALAIKCRELEWKKLVLAVTGGVVRSQRLELTHSPAIRCGRRRAPAPHCALAPSREQCSPAGPDPALRPEAPAPPAL